MSDAPQSIEEIQAQVEARIKEENELLPPPATTPEEDSVITPDLIRQCLANNERGDGILYSALHRELFIFVKKSQEWFKFSGHYWELDVYQEYLRAVERVAIAYKNEADSLDPQIKELNKQLSEHKESLKCAQARVKSADKAIKEALRDGTGVAEAEVQLATAQNDVAALTDQLREVSIPLGKLITEQKAFHRRIDRLRSINGAQKCAEWAHIVERPLAITGDELDQQPWLLPCKNGVIDLRTGELRPGVPGDWLSKAIPLEYAGFDHPAPEWEKFLGSVQPDAAIGDFLHTLFGYSISGLTHEQFICCFIGPGRNGKGLFFEMLEEVLGPFYWAIQSELLLDSKFNRSSAGASPDKLALRGRRIVAASETDQGRRISAAAVKELTGNDTLNARLLYDKHDTNFRPTHKTFLRSQYIPEGLTKDFALRERLIYITFPYMFVDDPEAKGVEDPNNAHLYRQKDRGLKDRLMAERQGILSWLVRGFARWMADGRLTPPDSIRQAVNDLHQAEDYVGRFIAERCVRSDATHYVVYNDFYKQFVEWYCEEECIEDNERNKKFIPSSKRVSSELKAKGFESPPKEKTSGRKLVYGLGLTL